MEQLEDRVCSGGCGIKFRALPSSPLTVARWDCAQACKGEKYSRADSRRRVRIQEAAQSCRTAVIFRDVDQGKGRKEENAARDKEVEMARLKAVEDKPLWLSRFESVAAAAAKLGPDVALGDCVEKAGLNAYQWATAFAKARKEIPARIEELYAAQGWRFRRARSEDGRAAAPQAEEFEESAAEAAEEPYSVGEAMSNATAWLERLDGDARRRAYIAVGIMLGFDEVSEILAAPAKTRETTQTRRKPGRPKNKGRGR